MEQCRLLTELTFFRDSYCIFKSQRSVFLESAVKQLVIAVQLISDSAGPVRALQGRLSGCYASCLSVKTTRVWTSQWREEGSSKHLLLVFFVPNRIQTKKTFPNWQTVRLTGHVHGVSISSVLSTKDAKYSSPKLGVVIAKKSSAFSETGANASSLKTAFLSSSWQLFFFPKRDNLNSSLS